MAWSQTECIHSWAGIRRVDLRFGFSREGGYLVENRKTAAAKQTSKSRRSSFSSIILWILGTSVIGTLMGFIVTTIHQLPVAFKRYSWCESSSATFDASKANEALFQYFVALTAIFFTKTIVHYYTYIHTSHMMFVTHKSMSRDHKMPSSSSRCHAVFCIRRTCVRARTKHDCENPLLEVCALS
jgi:Na+/alanine symporter